jgi:polyhydroxyalkanoate synthase
MDTRTRTAPARAEQDDAPPAAPHRATPEALVEPSSARAPEAETQRLDRLFHAATVDATGGLSPVSLALAWADWAWHLAVSPGRQMELAARAAQAAGDTWRELAGQLPSPAAGEADDDPRFRHPAWAAWPFNALRAGFRNAEAFWRDASCSPGMSAHHKEMSRFFAKQWLAVMAPANWLATNPVVLQDAFESGGAHLAKGAMNWLRDATGQPDPEVQAEAARFQVGRDLAVTPGDVVLRNRLIELIRYAPQTAKVHPEPVFVVPSWIMKYYILDLSPHNSMVRYLVRQGHVVYMLSWRNPDAGDHDLSMDHYLRLGLLEPLAAIRKLHGTRHVHAMGYCLGGTLLAIAAAWMARRRGATNGLPHLATLTLLAAQTDFSEPGELGLFIDESQVGYLDEIMRGRGYLTGKQMAGSFQFLHSRDLVWTRRMKEYLMGEREKRSDLTAWNADTTRMPARMHHEYLTALYLHNALANSSYRVEGKTVSLGDIRLPIFLVGTERDHISPWRSVYKLHHLCDSEITFVLTVGGHNAGIVSEPGHAGRSYRMMRRPFHGPWIEPADWLKEAKAFEGSWWPAWHEWLAAHSGALESVERLAPEASLGAAPGAYVMQRYPE